jgi:hypothetical protein
MERFEFNEFTILLKLYENEINVKIKDNVKEQYYESNICVDKTKHNNLTIKNLYQIIKKCLLRENENYKILFINNYCGLKNNVFEYADNIMMTIQINNDNIFELKFDYFIKRIIIVDEKKNNKDKILVDETIIKLISKIEIMENQINTIQNQNNTIQNQNNTMQNQINTMQNQNNTMQNQINTMELTIKNNNLYYLGDKLINSTMNKILNVFNKSFIVENLYDECGNLNNNRCNSIFTIYAGKFCSVVGNIIYYDYINSINEIKNIHLNKYEKTLKNILLHVKNNLSINNQYKPKAINDLFINGELQKLNNALYMEGTEFLCNCLNNQHSEYCIQKKNKLNEYVLFQNTTIQNFIDEIIELYK